METGIYMTSCRFSCCVFKSYYVVWKPHRGSSNEICAVKFKSYYVVWKLELPVHSCAGIHSFKSYYVVWKPRVGTAPTLAFAFV